MKYKVKYSKSGFDNKVTTHYNECLVNNTINIQSIKNDDFNTPNTITYLLELVKLLNSEIRNKGNNICDITSKILVICDVLGLKYDMTKFTDEDIELYNNWMNARVNKDFEKADMYRNKLIEKNIL